MTEQQLLIFGAIGIVGLAIIILGFKFSEKTRKVVETTGAILFHVGVFGILYYKVSLNLFISLVALVISLFILIDPLKIGDHLNVKIYRLFGYITLFAAVAFSLDFFSGFPVWLWTVPLVIYLSPYLISPLKKNLKIILALAWLVVFSYVGLIGYVIYAKYNPNTSMTLIHQVLPQLHVPPTKEKVYTEKDFVYHPPIQETKADPGTETKTDQKTKTADTTKTTPQDITKDTKPADPKIKVTRTKLEPEKDKTVIKQETTPEKIMKKPETTSEITPTTLSGPYLKGLKEADDKFIQLQKQYQALQIKYKEAINENKKLIQEIDEIKNSKKTDIQETL